MKNLKSFLTIALSLSLIIAISCKEEDDEPKVSNTDFLTANKWKTSQFETSVKGVVNKDGLKDCDKDDVRTFFKDGKYLVDQGPNLCDPDEENESGTWGWKNQDEKILRFVSDTEVTDAEFVRLSATSFKITATGLVELDNDNKVDDEFKIVATYVAL